MGGHLDIGVLPPGSPVLPEYSPDVVAYVDAIDELAAGLDLTRTRSRRTSGR